MSNERRPLSIGERWRREASRSADSTELDKAAIVLETVRHPRLRMRAGAIHTEMEGTMGSINEVAIHVPTLSSKIWPQVARVMRRSPSMIDALQHGRVPRSFDRLVARISGESVFPDGRKITSACTCGEPEDPCRHVLALHELFARRLGDKPWELLVVRGVNLPQLIEDARDLSAPDDLPPLPYGSPEEPVLYPEGEDGDLDSPLTAPQVADLVGSRPAALYEAVVAAWMAYAESEREEPASPDADDDPAAGDASAGSGSTAPSDPSPSSSTTPAEPDLDSAPDAPPPDSSSA